LDLKTQQGRGESKMELKERTPPSNARYEEAGEIELADGTFIAIFRYPEGKIRVQAKQSRS
jgi:hypothetical protein